MFRPLVRCTVDASVFVNAFLPHETGHEASAAFLARVQRDSRAIIVPTLALVEVAATIRRVRSDPAAAQAFASLVARLPGLTFVPLDATFMWEAVDVVTRSALRGSDAVYGAVAQKYGTLLVTRDREQRQRLDSIVPVRTPEEALALM